MRNSLWLALFFVATTTAQPEISAVECEKRGTITGVTGEAMKLPTDVAVDRKGRVYVVDSGNHRVLAFSVDGKYLFSFGSQGSGPGELVYPVGIDASMDGRVLVADRGNERVQIFNRDGKFLKTIKTSGEGMTYTPIDVAVSRNEERIYVTVSAPYHQVIVLDNDGGLKSKWGKPGDNEGEFRYPATIAVSREEDEIYVVDVLNTRTQVFGKKGNFLVTVGSWGVTQGQLFRPKGVALTNNSQILISDSYLGVIQLYDSDTRFSGILTREGDIARFNTPEGIAVDERNRVYVAEAMANRVSVCQLKP